MKEIKCKNCAAVEFEELSPNIIKCKYCGTTYKEQLDRSYYIISKDIEWSTLLDKLYSPGSIVPIKRCSPFAFYKIHNI